MAARIIPKPIHNNSKFGWNEVPVREIVRFTCATPARWVVEAVGLVPIKNGMKRIFNACVDLRLRIAQLRKNVAIVCGRVTAAINRPLSLFGFGSI